ncbi:MAG: HPr kinase/phosphatase C-terminal domain-containing protein [Hyphomicrobiaceae bacterium]|nr:HPr kinase/phosphatase C-terminal domain-containing protein [Hyphomicrobiaceae bacterium]
MAAAPDHIHATCIALAGAAVLIRGPSGSGKSDLALRCLALPPHALWGPSPQLVADDQVLLTKHDGLLRAASPATIRGKLEVRGLGILECDAISNAKVCLVADLVPPGTTVRFPEQTALVTLFGVDVPHLQIAPFEQSAPLKLLLALARLARG